MALAIADVVAVQNEPEITCRPIAGIRPARSSFWRVLLAFGFGFALMSYVQSGAYEPTDRDGFYHTKMAALMGSGEVVFPEKFPWLCHTLHNRYHFVSHHYGLHMLMAPFVHASKWAADHAPAGLRRWATKSDDSGIAGSLRGAVRSWLASPYILGAKALVSVVFGLILALFVVLIRLLDAAWLWFWVISIAALPSDFLLRMSYARAPGISLLMMLAIIWACIRVRPVVLAVLAFCYCHIYLGGVMYTPLIVGAFIASYAVCGQERDVRACVKLAAGAVVGISLAVVTNPFRGDVLQFLYTQVFESGLQTTQNRVSVGNEWKPYDLYDWARMSCYVLVVFATTVVFRSTWNRIMDPRILALLIINVGFLGLCMRARRFIEYWPALCLLSSAALWAGFDRTLASLRGRLAAAPEAASLVGRVGLAACVGAGAVGLFTAANARDVATCRFDIPQIKTAMAYLAEVSKPGDVVFADDWDVFPMFFYYNHHNYYVCGLDPQFVNSIDPELWERYAVITQGRAPKTSRVYVAGAGGAEEVKEFEVTIDDVREKFDATWVIVDSDHAGFYRQMRDRPDLFTQVFPPPKPADRKPPPLSIFRVTPQDQ